MEKRVYTNVEETVYYGVTSSGLPVYVLSKPGYTKSYAYYAVNYGGIDRRFNLGGHWTETPAGVAHFLEHKMFDMPNGRNALQSLTAMGAQPNAHTSYDSTGYLFECSGKLYTILESMLNFVGTPFFTAESVQKEQGIIRQEILMSENDPGSVMEHELRQCLFSAHPIKDDIVGTVDSVGEITPEILYQCYGAFYNPANMALCVAGDVDPEKVFKIADKATRKMSGSDSERDYGPAENLNYVKRESVREIAVSPPMYSIGAKVSSTGDIRGKERYRRVCAADVACRYLLSSARPFYERIYNDGVIIGGISSGIINVDGALFVTIGGASMKPGQVYDAIVGEAERVVQNGLDETIFTRMKKAYLGADLRSYESLEGMCQRLAIGHFRNMDYFADALNIILDISADELRQFIAETLTPERMAISIAQPPSAA
jgi:predicted Zn-dependent peptidase